MKASEFNHKADVYSFGITLWEMTTGKEPFEKYNDVKEFVTAVAKFNERPTIPNGIPESLSELMRECWDKDPEKRPEFTEIVDRLSTVIIDSAISDQLGNTMWKKYFFNQDKVFFTEFISKFYEFLGIVIPEDLNAKDAEGSYIEDGSEETGGENMETSGKNEDDDKTSHSLISYKLFQILLGECFRLFSLVFKINNPSISCLKLRIHSMKRILSWRSNNLGDC